MTEDSAESEEVIVATRFVDAINRHDTGALLDLMDRGHEFIDSAGTSIKGTAALLEAWTGYFELFPDYRVDLDRVAQQGTTVVLLGSSSGKLSQNGREALSARLGEGFDETALQGPAIWTAEIADGVVTRWRVYEDTEDMRRVLRIS